nr:hypothetical protein Iba_chr02bCG8220 [Ipomoea batatas]
MEVESLSEGLEMGGDRELEQIDASGGSEMGDRSRGGNKERNRIWRRWFEVADLEVGVGRRWISYGWRWFEVAGLEVGGRRWMAMVGDLEAMTDVEEVDWR